MGTWEIFTYGNGELLAMIFNGIVAIMGDSNFTTLIRLVGAAGILWVIFRAAFFTATRGDWSWLVAFVAIYGIVFVPKTNVTIVDRLVPSATRTIANVPIGLAAFAGTMSRVGDWMTRAAETVFTLPDDLQYQRSGAVFSARLISSAREFRITDPDFEANLAEFMRQCVYYDLLLRHYTWRDLLEAPNAWTFIANNTSQLRRVALTCYTPAGGGGNLPGCSRDGQVVVPICRTAAQQFLNDAWQRELARAADIYGRLIYPNEINQALATNRLIGALPVSYDYIAQISANATDIMRGNMLANIWKQSLGNAAASTDATAATQQLALTQAEERQRSTYAILGQLMAKWLPLMRNLYEAILYGVFPFVFLLFLTPWGVRVAGGYFKNIVWLQLWPPIFAILNLAMTLNQRDASQALVGGPVNGLSIAMQAGLGDIASDTAILAGYMTMSIPLIAYGLVSGGQMALTQLASQIGAVAQSAAARSADLAATGNVSMGNVSMENTGMFRNTTSPATDYGAFSYRDPATGALYQGATDSDYLSVAQMRSQVAFSASTAHTVSASARQAYEAATQAAQKQADQYAKTLATTLADGTQFLQSSSRGHSYTDNWTNEQRESWKDVLSTHQKLSDTMVNKMGFERREADQISWSILAGIGAGMGSNSIRASLEGTHLSQDQFSHLYSTARENVDGQDISKALEGLRGAVKQAVSSDTYGHNEQLATQLQSELRETEQAQRQLSRELARMEQARTSWELARDFSDRVETDRTDEFVLVAQRAGVDVGDLHIRPDLQTALMAQYFKNLGGLQLGTGHAPSLEDKVAAMERAWQQVNSGNKDGAWRQDIDAITFRATGGEQAVHQAYADMGIPGQAQVRQQHAENHGRVVGPGPGSAASRGFDEMKHRLGRLPSGMQEHYEDHKNRVERDIQDGKLDRQIKSTEVMEKGNEHSRKTHEKVAKGAEDTTGLF